MRLAVYTDYAYHRVDGELRAERAFALFLERLRPSFERLILVGRLSPPRQERARYPLGEGLELAALPYYPALSQPLEALPALARSLLAFWRTLTGVDCVWLLGPHPLAVAFAVLAAARRRRVVLGVRQDLPAYVSSRHPGRTGLKLAALALEGAFRALARIFPTVVVGAELAHKYRRSRRLLQIAVSLVDEDEIVDPEVALERDYAGDLQVLAVGRLETEKNPTLMADVLARLNRSDGPRWRLVVLGEGALRDELIGRLRAVGQDGRAEVRGYVSFGTELTDTYRSSHALLHVSLTEGLPQVLLEACAAGLPVVASDVGGISGAPDGVALLFRPNDAEAAADALRAVAADPALRARMVRAGNRFVRARTAGVESGRVAAFLLSGR